MRGKFISWMFVFLFLVLSSNTALSLGVTPGRKTLDFSSGLETSVDISILNNENKEMNVLVYVEGELNDSVTLLDTLISFKSTDSSKKFTYNVRLPQILKEPGQHEARVIIREVPINRAGEGSIVGATNAVVSQLYVLVPYPGKYAKAEIRTFDNPREKSINFLVVVNNLGTQDIVNAKGLIDILSPTNQKIATINTDKKPVKSKTKEELVSSWDIGAINPGTYLARLSLLYDEEVASTQAIFNVGEMLFDILDVSVSDFKLGGIAKFNILVENRWSSEVKGVYSEMIITDQKGDEITRFKSATKDVKGLEKSQLISFWDTAGVKEGTYSGRVVVYYGDKTTEKQLKAVVSLNEIKTQFVGVNAQAISIKGGSTSSGILMFVILILVGVNIFWFVYFKRKNARATTQL